MEVGLLFHDKFDSHQFPKIFNVKPLIFPSSLNQIIQKYPANVTQVNVATLIVEST